MARACTCDRYKRNAPYTPEQCLFCWAYMHSAYYRAGRDGITPMAAAKLVLPRRKTKPANAPPEHAARAASDAVPCGDVFKALASKIGADRLAKWWETMTGKPCGCEERRQKMNAACALLQRWLGWFLRVKP